MLNIFDVAWHILDSIGGEVSPEKLHALCYYAQGWHLAMYGTPLFEEDFVKCENWDWERGPVEGAPLVGSEDGHCHERTKETPPNPKP